MKNRIFKIGLILLVILSMTMANLIFVSKNLISYAVDTILTNHQNVEFEAYFKDANGNKITTLEEGQNQEETFLYLGVNVVREGYFTGEITLENSNFVLKETDSEYVSKIENNTIYLNDINVGAMKEIKVKIQPMQNQDYDIGLLNMESTLKLTGIYRDSTEKDIEIEANRNVQLKLIENNTQENVLDEIELITNKIVQINGEEKRIVQFSYNMGLKENNYPVKEINSKIAIPTIDEKQPIIECEGYLNNMSSFDYNYDGEIVDLTLRNSVNDENKANWKLQGLENIVLTCIYEKDIDLENIEITSNQKVILYNDKEIETNNSITIFAEELDSNIQIESENSEGSIYKGKLYAGIARQFENTAKLKVNYVPIITNIELAEEESKYIVGENQIIANVIYNKTSVKKSEFDKMFGQDGVITVYDQNEEVLGTITNSSVVDEQGNITISYEGKNVTRLLFRTTAPKEEGILELKNTKTIQENSGVPMGATELRNKITAQYNMSNSKQENETSIQLENTVTQGTLEVNKDSLSTVVSNNVEIKAVLLTNNEKYDLYTNPQIIIQLPEQVENITINSVDLLYENELTISNYRVNGKTIEITLRGTQTQYHEDTIAGSMIVINATIDVNKKSATSDQAIQMTYINGKQVTYASGETGIVTEPIKIVAPKDITTIYNIQDLGIETIGQEETKQIILEKSVESKELKAQMEVINNNQSPIQNVKILGNLPTNNNENNMGIQIVNGITTSKLEGVKIYYTENSNATDELGTIENGWTETLTDVSKVSKYLIVVDYIEAGSSIEGSYTYKIPANLEYNQVAKTGYVVKNTNSTTQVESQLKSTVIEMNTGIGPEIQTKLTATKGGEAINEPVKNGEVIRYNIEVANTGTEDISTVTVKGNVPEGTTMVEPEEDYEYTGASYYEELENTVYETTIENLKVGEVVNKQYEVRVNNNVEQGTVLSNIAEVKYAEVTKQTNEIQNVTAKGNLRVTVKRITDRETQLYKSDLVEYFAIIENISNTIQENITVKTNLSDGFNVTKMELCDEQGTTIEEMEYSKQINIGTLEPNQIKMLYYVISIDSEDEPFTFFTEVEQGQDSYKSNEWKDSINKVEVELYMDSNTKSEYVKTGDEIEYNINVTNKVDTDANLVIVDSIPKQLTVTDITINGEEIGKVNENYTNNTETYLQLGANSTSNMKIKAIVNYSSSRDQAEPITNVASAQFLGKTIATTSSINHIIEANPNDSEGNNEENNGNGNNNENNVENPNIAEGNRTITGTAWFDENANGQKESGEELLKNIKVKLLNTKTNNLVRDRNGNILEATTNENGVYVLDKIGNGEYIVIFEYDDLQYGLTKYKLEGIQDSQNSDAILNELLIENEPKQVASTDIITINNNNISNIDIGLIKLQNFDLKLDKYVSRILIQNASGSTVTEYTNANLAKTEIPGQYLNGSTVIIEYKINVTNNGEVAGYAKQIADYAPSDLRFSSELNKNWYQVGDVLYTNQLANEEIKPNETKSITLTLTKSMTENNTGSIQNIAEISEDYNQLGIQDTNSIPGNREKTENDYGVAGAIISIKTGGEVVYAGVAVAIVVLIGVVAIVIAIKKKNDNGELEI